MILERYNDVQKPKKKKKDLIISASVSVNLLASKQNQNIVSHNKFK